MTIWYTARGAGLAAMALLTLSVFGGVLAGAPRLRPATRVVAQYAHRAGALLGLGLLALHMGMILADSYAGVGWLGALVPFMSGYRAWQVALGTTALYLLVILAATGLLRGRLASSPRMARAWRPIHCSAYLAWTLAILHGFTVGTDSNLNWTRLLYIGCTALVLIALLARQYPRRFSSGYPVVPDYAEARS